MLQLAEYDFNRPLVRTASGKSFRPFLFPKSKRLLVVAIRDLPVPLEHTTDTSIDEFWTDDAPTQERFI